MRGFLIKTRTFFTKLYYRIPTTLPQGKIEFYDFANSILNTYDFPHNDSFMHMIASMLQHLPEKSHKASRHKLMMLMKRAIAGEVAYYILVDIKENAKKLRVEEEMKLAKESNHVSDPPLQSLKTNLG